MVLYHKSALIHIHIFHHYYEGELILGLALYFHERRSLKKETAREAGVCSKRKVDFLWVDREKDTWKFHEKQAFQQLHELKILISGDN